MTLLLLNYALTIDRFGGIVNKIILGIVCASAALMPTQIPSAIAEASEGIQANVVEVQGGGSLTTFEFPDGSIMKVSSDINTETLMALNSDELQDLGIPPKPSLDAELSVWLEMYSKTNEQKPSLSIKIIEDATTFASIYSGNWGGYLAGTRLVQNSSYVAVKANFKVPTVAESCISQPGYIAGAWVGLGGTNNGADDLVQQGIGWCNPNNSVNKWTPWTEFAGTQEPFPFCNYTNWAFNTGDIIYNNMSFQASTDTAYFYMQNQTTGVAHSCSRTAPKNWTFNGNTAECIVERPGGVLLANYGTLKVTNCQVELGSNSTWYPIGQRSSVKEVLNGYAPPGILYQRTGSLAADDKSFTMTFLHK